MENRYKPKRIVPPPTIKKEAMKVWEGWNNLGNREVVREAGIKGTHLEEVVIFLALRQEINKDVALHWFKKEVSLFVDELLDRKQIFRACHILQNVKEEPSKELTKKMYTTCDAGLREYIGSHLLKFGTLDKKVAHLWNFLHIMTKHSGLLTAKFTLERISLEILERQESEWKWELASILFLKSYDERLFPFLKAETLWTHLLRINETEILKVWINIRYGNNGYVEPSNIHTNLKNFMCRHPISSVMVDVVMNNISHTFTQESVLNELSRFGVFCAMEKTDIVKMMKRLFSVNCLENVFSIISSSTSVVSVESFMDLLINLCLESGLFGVINAILDIIPANDVLKHKYISNKHFDLMCDFRYMSANFNALALRQNLFKVSQYLSDESLTEYLGNNCEIALALLLLTKDCTFLETIVQNKGFYIEDVYLNDACATVLEKYTLMRLACDTMTKPKIKKVFTFYDILVSGNVVNVREIFEFRFNKDIVAPHFSNDTLLEQYGCTKSIDHTIFVRHNRPTVAAAIFVNDKINKHDKIPECELKKAIGKATKFGLLNVYSDEKCITAVSFLEMLGVDTEMLRTNINAVKLLNQKDCDINLSTYSEQNLHELFASATSDLDNVRDCMEKVLVDKVNFVHISHNGSELITSIKLHNLVVKFCRLHNLRLPALFLKLLAKNNLWFQFLLFAQVNDYPMEQVRELIHSFTNPNIIEHVEHAITHDTPMHGHSSLMRRRDSRSSYLSRVGVRREHVKVESISQPGTSKDPMETSYHSPKSRTTSTSTTGSSEYETLVLRPRATLLQILILCHDSNDPPRALLQSCQYYKYPLLAVFATCYEPESVVTCWLTWLAVSCDLCQDTTNYETIGLCPRSVSNLLSTCLEKKYPKTLLDGFNVFLSENPLKIFVEFINLLINFSLDSSELSSKVKQFGDTLNKIRRASVITDTDIEMTYLTNKAWIQYTSLQLLGAALNANFTSLSDVILVLQAVSKLDWTDIFSDLICPGFSSIVSVLNVLYEQICVGKKRTITHKSALKINFRKLFDNDTHRKEIIDCINSLLDKHLFDAALQVAQLEDISIDLVKTREWEYKYKYNTKRPESFWQNCDNELIKFKITPNCAVDFYLDRLEDIKETLEIYRIQKLACKWATQFELPNQYDLETMLWLTYINLDRGQKEHEKFECQVKIFCFKKLIEELENVPVYFDVGLTESQKMQVDQIIKDMLDVGNFWQALKLEKMFECKNIDLDILKLCSSLAEGVIKPYQLNQEQQSLLTTKRQLRRTVKRVWAFLATKTSSVQISGVESGSEGSRGSPVQDILAILQTLMENLSSGIELGENIFMIYRISVNIEVPYTTIVDCTDSQKMLKSALENDCMNKIEVVSDFITVYEWSKEQIADFVCEAIVSAASIHITSKIYTLRLWDLDIDRNFSYILHLLQDNCSLLGYHIFSYTSAIYAASVASDVVFKLNDLILMSELLIRAHDCFSMECNMEGITLVLRKCHKIVGHLLDLKCWKLMVRLLTGIGRYSEMKYIFHILKDHDQFEYLLRRHLSKDTAFKFALLEFLTRYCPSNNELLKMVALHFALYSEVAQLWENEAKTVINNLISIAKLEMQNNKIDLNKEIFVIFTNNDGTEKLLKKAIENFEHATEFYIEGEKFKKAACTARQCQLLGLQVSLLKALPINEGTPCLLNLEPEQIDQALRYHLGFFPSKVLTEAYYYQPEWGALLFEHYVIQNNTEYLKVFLNTFHLTDTIVGDILKQFISVPSNDAVIIKRMKVLVENIHSVHTKYRVASQLGFKDVVEELLEGDQLFYLKDTVWKRGYRT